MFPQKMEFTSLSHALISLIPIHGPWIIGSTFGAPLYNVWGATEVVGSLTFGLRPVRIVKGAQIRLIDEIGVDVAEGEVGELSIRGAN
jgi:long-chain acyl-CoA synthetase